MTMSSLVNRIRRIAGAAPCILAGCLALISAAHAQPSGGSAVSFDSPDATGKTVTLRGMLWSPTGKARGAIVLVHGSGGWSDFREGHYGRAFSAAGFAVLAIDTFGPRGITQTVDNQALITPMQMTRDAFAARRFLLSQGLSAERMAVMGFSKGGAVALFAADRNFLPAETERFAVSIPFYPGCAPRPLVPKPASVVYMALGEKDNYTGVAPCQAHAADYAKAGGKVTVKIYPDAAHGFDGDPARTGMFVMRFAENYSDCFYTIDEDGRLGYAGKKYGTYDDGLEELRAELQKTCMKKGAAVWTNPTQKEAATRDVIDFLNGVWPN
jgi:dienelactone hydrolase